MSELEAACERLRVIVDDIAPMMRTTVPVDDELVLEIDEGTVRDIRTVITGVLADQSRDDGEITPEWLREIGFLQDGEFTSPIKLGKRIWDIHEHESDGSDPAMQLLFDSADNSWWLETFDQSGSSLCLVELAQFKVRQDVLDLMRLLNIPIGNGGGA